MKKKLLITSILSVIMCMSLIVGATFALFTSEDNVDITVTSGEVKIEAEIANTQYKTLQEDWTSFDTTANLAIGGAITVDNTTGAITFNKVVPGDGIKFDVNVDNSSNVKVKFRTIATNTSLDDTLFNVLKISINGQEFSGKSATKWTELEAEVDPETIKVEIELPENVKGDEYMNKTCTLNVLVEAVQGNADVLDYVIVREDVATDATTNLTTEDKILDNNEYASAKVKQGTLLNDGAESLTLNVSQADEADTGAFKAENGEEVIAFNISIPEVDPNNTQPIVVTLEGVLEPGLDGVILFHKGVPMLSVSPADAVDAEGEFCYDATNGNVTLATINFSNFTIVSGAENFMVPKAEISVFDDADLPTDDIWVIEGTMGGIPFPEVRDDVALEKAFKFVATQTEEEVQYSEYKNWIADFVISCDEDIALGELGLSGQYEEAFGETWFTFGNPIELAAGERLPMLVTFGYPFTYEMICTTVKEFNCGIFRGQNNKSMAGKTITVSLCIANYDAVPDADSIDDFSEEDGTLKTIASIDYTFEVLPEGQVNSAFTSETGFWGDWGGNASESFEIKFYDGNEFLGSTSLNNVDGIIDGDVYVTWNLPLKADLGVSVSDCGYWTYNWVKKPTLVEDGENGLVLNPITATLYIDGTEVGSTVVVLNGPDGINKIVACVVNENNEIVKFLTKLSFEDLVDPYIVLLSDVDLNDSLVIG